MKSILIATHNPGKLKDIRKGLVSLEKKGITIVSLNDLNITKEPEETGTTFEENTLLKAKYYASLTNLPTISDDGGLTIDILNGEPGVKSRRWPGYAATDEELIQFALNKLNGIPREKRKAALQTCVGFYDPHTKDFIVECEKNSGYIAEKPTKQKTKGYPYRALFILDATGSYYDELTPEQHEQFNHRLLAVKRLSKKIEKYFI